MRLIVFITLFLFPFYSLNAQQDILWNYQKIAIDSSATLKADYIEYEMAVERIHQVSSLPDPTIAFAYGLSPVETRLGPQQSKISVTQMFPWFGTLGAKEQQAACLATAAYEDYILQRNKLVYDVSISWYSLFLYFKSIDNIDKQIAILEMLERQASIKFEGNESNLINVLRFQMAKEELITKKMLLIDQKKTVQSQFNSFLNRNADAKINLSDSLLIPNDRIFCLDSIMKNNPKLKIIDAKYAATQNQIKAAERSGYPSIGIGVDYAFIGQRTDMQVENSGKNAIMPMLSASIPVNRRKYVAKKNEAQLNRKLIAYNRIATQNTLRVDFEKAMQDYNNAKRNIKLNSNLLEKGNKALNIMQTAYATSGMKYDQLLEVQNSVLKYQIAYYQSIIDLYKAIAYLDFLSVY